MKKNEIPLGYTRVTSVLQPFSTLNNIDSTVLKKAADRGTRAHRFCELYALNLFVGEVDDDCKGYFKSFCEWFDFAVERVLCCESRFNCCMLKLSGAVDLIVQLKGDDYYSIIDIKTPAAPSISWQLQTAAYRMLARQIGGIHTENRMCLMLPKSGEKAKVVCYENHEKDEDLFFKAYELYKFFKIHDSSTLTLES